MELEIKYTNIIEEIENASIEIPFGNSEFQNINTVLAGELTQARAYRHCLLRLNDRLTALREYYYNSQLDDIDIEELEYKLTKEENEFEKRRLKINIEHKKINREKSKKFVFDCKKEIETLYNAFKKLPKFTRLEFEAQEREHFELKHTQNLVNGMKFGGSAGVAKALSNMGINADRKIEEFKQNPKNLENRVFQNQKMILSGISE